MINLNARLVHPMIASKTIKGTQYFDTSKNRTVVAREGDILLSCPGFATLITVLELEENYLSFSDSNVPKFNDNTWFTEVRHRDFAAEVELHFVTETMTGKATSAFINIVIDDKNFITKSIPLMVARWMYQKHT